MEQKTIRFKHKFWCLALAIVATILWQLFLPPLHVEAKDVTGISGFTVDPAHASGYPVISGETYFNTANIPGAFEDARFIITDTHGMNYIAFCADYSLAPPTDPDPHEVLPNLVSDASALAVAMASPAYGAMLSTGEFNALFGITGDDQQRALILSAFVWAMETTKDIDIAADLSAWPESLDSLKGSLTGRVPTALYETVASGIKAMLEAYDPAGVGGISGLTLIYDDVTGKLTYGFTGYGSPSLSLTVNGDAETYINGEKYTFVNKRAISLTDSIYIYAAGEISITVSTASPLILQNGSIRGDLLKNVINAHFQNLVTGHAQFGAATSEIVTAAVAAKEAEIPFVKVFDCAHGDIAPDSIFTFRLQEVDAGGEMLPGGFSAAKIIEYEEGRSADVHFSFDVGGLVPATGSGEEISPRHFYYKVTESNPGAGWSIVGANPIFVRLTVSPSEGPDVEYAADIGGPWGSLAGGDNVFNNQYSTPVHVEYAKIEAGKTVSGAWLGSRAFNVVLTRVGSPYDLSPLPAPDDYMEIRPVTVSADGTGLVNFTAIGYTIPGKYYYTITEVPDSDADWLFDDSLYIAEVAVGDDMAVDVKYFKRGGAEVDGVVFTNYYLSADFEVTVDKVVYGAFSAISPTFSFTMREIDESGNPTGAILRGVTHKEIANMVPGKPESATFSVSDVSPGVHYYEIFETAAASTGWSYDTGRMIVRVEVLSGTDTLIPGTGIYFKRIFVDYPIHPDNLNAKGEGFANAKNSPIFTNVYTSADTSITITKTITGLGNPGYVNQQFSFDVQQVDENGEPVTLPPLNPPVSSLLTTSGTATLRTMSLQLRGLAAGTYYYKVTERDLGGAGWAYDTAPLYLKVVVEGNTSNAGLEVTYEVYDGISGAKTDRTFRNAYYLGSASLMFTKAYASDPETSKSFSYDLTLLEGEGDDPKYMSPTGSCATLANSSGTGVKTFSGNTSSSTGNTLFNVAILRNLAPGAYYYSISEQPNLTAGVNWNGWDHGTERLYCKVTVGATSSDVEWWDGTGWVGQSVESAAFRTITNTYTNSGKGSGAITLGGTKTIGNDVIPPDSPLFVFTLTELNSNDADDVKDGGLVRTTSSYGSFSGALFSFPILHLEVEHDARLEYKDYYFKAEETTGGGDGWSNDPAVYVLTVRVWSYPTVVEVIEVSGKLFGSSHPNYDGDFPLNTAFTFADMEFVNSFSYPSEPSDPTGPPGETEEPEEEEPGEEEPGDEDGDTEEPPEPGDEDGDTEEPPKPGDGGGDSGEPPEPGDEDGDTEEPPEPGDEGGDTEKPHEHGETEGSDNPGDHEFPYVPGGYDRDVPPNPTVPGNELVADEDGWIEYGPDGSPLGKWEWDDEEEIWVFDPFPPLAALPDTGLDVIPVCLLVLFGAGLVLAGLFIRRT